MTSSRAFNEYCACALGIGAGARKVGDPALIAGYATATNSTTPSPSLRPTQGKPSRPALWKGPAYWRIVSTECCEIVALRQPARIC